MAVPVCLPGQMGTNLRCGFEFQVSGARIRGTQPRPRLGKVQLVLCHTSANIQSLMPNA